MVLTISILDCCKEKEIGSTVCKILLFAVQCFAVIDDETARTLKEIGQALLYEHTLTIESNGQLIVSGCGKACKRSSCQLCDNTGFDSTDVLAWCLEKTTWEIASVWVDLSTGAGLHA